MVGPEPPGNHRAPKGDNSMLQSDAAAAAEEALMGSAGGGFIGSAAVGAGRLDPSAMHCEEARPHAALLPSRTHRPSIPHTHAHPGRPLP